MTTPLEELKQACEQVLTPLVYRDPVPLSVSVFQCPDRRPYSQVVNERFTLVEPGWQWGPKWSTAWFRVQGRVTDAMVGKHVVLRFSSGTEALLWLNGSPYHGFDLNRDAASLFPNARGIEHIDGLIEAACNHPLGVGWFFWDKPEVEQRWSTDTPGRLERCELAVFDEHAWRAYRTTKFLIELAEQLPEDSPRREQLQLGIAAALGCHHPGSGCHVASSPRAATHSLAGDIRKPQPTPRQVLADLTTLLPGDTPTSRTRCFAVGHAHLDTAWMWPIGETKRKAHRTFANALRLMERNPDFKFLCSQPQQYDWIHRSAPALFQQIAERVKQGRWQPMGAMWIEPDGNLPSGESFARQLLHGTRYFERAFGTQGRQRLAYLPDTFGFAASLPQIFKLAGLDTFITNKLWWNETNEFPHLYFRWRGIDGTEILSHLTPGQEYNATNAPFELRRGQIIAERKDDLNVGVWLQPFGFGDGGGGPTDWNILNAQLAASCEGVPNTQLSGAAEFCDELHRRHNELKARGTDFPTYEGELYLERHRGTYTTQANVKRDNALAEANLRIAEWLTCTAPAINPRATDLGPARSVPPSATSRSSDLHEAWKLTLLNQFHDILPGSSIIEVYQDAAADHSKVHAICQAAEQQALTQWSAALDTGGLASPLAIFNPASSPRSQWIEWEDQGTARGTYVENVPALGVRTIDAKSSDLTNLKDAAQQRGLASARRTTPTSYELSNNHVSATIDHTGRITSLRDEQGDELAAAPLNQLALYADHPKYWEAWDLDAEALENPQLIETPAAIFELTTVGANRPAIRINRPLGKHSHITQTFHLSPGSPKLDIDTEVDWHEDRTLLRVLFPTTISADHVTCEIPFGHLQRSTRRDTPIEKARFEFPAHRWIDLSQPGRGLALLNDFKYGHSCQNHVMGLSLLRSCKWPDPTADMGQHRIRYSLMPHNGDWRAAGVDKEAELMIRGVWALPLPANHRGSIQETWSPLTATCEGNASVRIAAIKPAEDGQGLIIRLVEQHASAGSCTLTWQIPTSTVTSVDLLERPLPHPSLHHQGSRTTLALKPFQIVSLRVQ